MTSPAATILIVDDEIKNRKLFEALLRPEGYLTISVANGEEALTSIAQHAPDLILLDVMMPDMDGYQVAHQIKATPATASIPIIMVTAKDDHSARLAGLNAGAEEFLTKPVDRAELWLRVRNLLRLKAYGDLLQNHSAVLEQQVQTRTAELQRFRSAMDATADAIFLVSRSSMRFVEVNAAASKMLGYPREELFQLSPSQLLSVPLDELEKIYDAIIAGHVRSELTETKLRRKDGSGCQVEVHRHAQRSGADWIIVGVVRDITERKKTEAHLLRKMEELKDSEARFKDLTALSSDWYWEQDEHFRFTALSGEVGMKAGISAPAHFAKTRWELPGTKLSDGELATHIAVLEAHEPFADFTYEREGVEGGTRYLSISGRPIFDAQGTFKGYRGVGTDVTAVKAAEAQLLQKVEELDRSNLELGQFADSAATANKELESFAYSVSHDLRAPLRSLDGFSQVLLEDYGDKLDEEGSDSLNRIRAASQKMGVLIDDMLALSQVTRRQIALARLDLSEMAAEIVTDLRQREPQRQVEFIAAPGLIAMTDGHLMRIVLANLFENAWKFTGKRPQAKIEFGITDHEDKQAYFVGDNGAGFDMAYAGKLFGAFQRMHSTAEFEGTGIGLATVQRIIHRLGGQVWAKAAPDHGATFYFVLDAGGKP